jgi:hypothetical protein
MANLDYQDAESRIFTSNANVYIKKGRKKKKDVDPKTQRKYLEESITNEIIQRVSKKRPRVMSEAQKLEKFQMKEERKRKNEMKLLAVKQMRIEEKRKRMEKKRIQMEKKKARQAQMEMERSHNYNGYSRESHFLECILQSMGKERNMKMTKEDKEKIDKFIVATRMDPNHITKHHMRNILKMVGLSSYYKHVDKLTYEFSGRLDQFTQEQVFQLCEDHVKLINAWDKLIAPYKSNMIPCSVMIRKFCEMHGWYDHRDRFDELGNVDKMGEINRDWIKCCKYIGWPIVVAKSKVSHIGEVMAKDTDEHLI